MVYLKPVIDDAETPSEEESFEDDPEFEAMVREMNLVYENYMTQLYGPPETRDKRNRRYFEKLVRMHTEPVIRGILVALSLGGKDGTSGELKNEDLTRPLDQIINRHFGCGPCLRVIAVDDTLYTVTIDFGVPDAKYGGGGEYVIRATAILSAWLIAIRVGFIDC